MRTNEPVLIGVDVGTSSVKAVMAAPGGVILDSYGASHPTRRDATGEAEQDPAQWLRHVRAALDRFWSHPRAGQVQAIGITSQVNTHCFCDSALAPVAPAITWQDTRAGHEAMVLDAQLPAEDKIVALGAPIPIDASHALSRMAWMAAHRPAEWVRTRHVLLPKDWIIAQVTGEVGSDPLSAVGLAGMDLCYADAVLALLPRAADLLPPLRDPLDVAGRVSDGPFKGVPVATGTMDAWAAMFGLGVSGDGQAMYLSGTSEVLGVISSLRKAEPGIVVFPDWRGITLHAGPTQAGGASLDWVGMLLGADTGSLDALVLKALPTGSIPLFLPHLEGERAPLWNPRSRGSFVGLSSATGPEHLVASVMEGVAFSARLAFEAVERSAGQRVATLRHGGGGAMSDRWCQIRADTLGRQIARIATAQAGAMGALVMGGVAVGALPDLVTATDALVTVDRIFTPDPAAMARADDRFALYCDLYEATARINMALAT
jgi:xylulokinase